MPRLIAAPILLLGLLLSGGVLAADTDGDGVDDAIDNCIDHANASQLDSDGDGCGNACDADFTQDGSVGGPDYVTFRSAFGKRSTDPNFYAPADHDGDGVVGGPDHLIYRGLNGRTPGPSGDPNRDPVACP